MSDRQDPGGGRAQHPALPEVLPIFPLTGVLLLPRGRLPLNIFEPRYLAMTRDALGGERLIGMVQPSEPQGDDGARRHEPAGLSGRLRRPHHAVHRDRRRPLSDHADRRLALPHRRGTAAAVSGYRRVVPDWTPFARDREIPDDAAVRPRPPDPRPARAISRQRQLSADWSAIEKAPGEHLITSIAMACPFAPSEKQALLEAADLDERATLLTALVEMAAIKPTGEDGTGGTRH